jgi:Integrase core domain.
MDQWELNLVDFTSLQKYNDNYKYLFQVIDVFSKFIHITPLRPAVASAFESILRDSIYLKPHRRHPIWVRTNKRKQFLNISFQNLLKREGIQFLVC